MSQQLLKKTAIASSIAFLAFTQSANAIIITSTNDANELVNNLILPGSGIKVTSAELLFGIEGNNNGGCDECVIGPQVFSAVANPPQAGFYTNEDGTLGLPAPGIVLSSGNVNNFNSGQEDNESPDNEELEGPQNNLDGGFGLSATQEQQNLLEPITGESSHFDPVQLNITFDVDDDTDTVSFIAAFGSNEWPEFVGDFVDGFGLYLNGTNVAGALPTGADPSDGLEPINIDHPDMIPSPVNIGLSGMLAPNGIPLVRFDIPVTPGSDANTFTMIVADSNDDIVDTTVFLSSFGNFDADNGESEFTPILPDPSNPIDPETGGFVFNLPEVEELETIWIDPDVAVGYTYQTDGLFASVTAPSLLSVNDTDGYILSYLDNGTLVEIALLAGETHIFSIPVPEFSLSNINPELMLDPTDQQAFVTGLSFAVGGVGTYVTQTPDTVFVEVPEPITFGLFSLGLLGLGASVRRNKRTN